MTTWEYRLVTVAKKYAGRGAPEDIVCVEYTEDDQYTLFKAEYNKGLFGLAALLKEFGIEGWELVPLPELGEVVSFVGNEAVVLSFKREVKPSGNPSAAVRSNLVRGSDEMLG